MTNASPVHEREEEKGLFVASTGRQSPCSFKSGSLMGDLGESMCAMSDDGIQLQQLQPIHQAIYAQVWT